MDHFQGVTPQERYQNDVLNELRAIRELLVRNAQAVEHKPVNPVKPRQNRQIRSVAE